MELVELQTRAANQEAAQGGDPDKKKKPNGSQANGAADDDEPTGRQTVTGLKKKGTFMPCLTTISSNVEAIFLRMDFFGIATTQGSKTYILRSTLDLALIEIATTKSDPQVMEEEAADAREDEDYGSIINWSRTDQLPLLGVLYVILALILLNGKVMSDSKLLPPSSPSPISAIYSVSSLTSPSTSYQWTCVPFSSVFAYPLGLQ